MHAYVHDLVKLIDREMIDKCIVKSAMTCCLPDIFLNWVLRLDQRVDAKRNAMTLLAPLDFAFHHVKEARQRIVGDKGHAGTLGNFSVRIGVARLSPSRISGR
jgi:hypothetical protein